MPSRNIVGRLAMFGTPRLRHSAMVSVAINSSGAVMSVATVSPTPCMERPRVTTIRRAMCFIVSIPSILMATIHLIAAIQSPLLTALIKQTFLEPTLSFVDVRCGRLVWGGICIMKPSWGIMNG